MTAEPTHAGCETCGTPLAHDQRYCIQCGARRGPLPHQVARLIAALAERSDHAPGSLGHDPVDGGETAVSGEPTPGDANPARRWLPTPRLAAVAVMAMLAFGAEIGAAVGASGVVALSGTPLIVLKQAIAPAGTTPATPVADTGSVSSPPTSSVPASSASTTSPAPASSATTPATTPTTSTTTTSTTPTNSNPYGLPPVRHVFVIMLADQGYRHTFGSTDTYLSKTLPKQGKLIEWYYAVAGSELANEVALVSGQGPTEATENGCSTFANVVATGTARYGQVRGDGCVYPKKTATLAEQLTAAHLTWKAYVQGMALGRPQACRHPAVGSPDPDQTPHPGDPYVTERNPFVYFHSVIDAKTCRTNDVDLSQLSIDLQRESSTPSLAYIVPGRCDDGSDEPCTPGARSGVAGADSFLRTVVPQIKQSPAYQAGGLIAITFDQAPQTGLQADPSACCATPRYPNLPAGLPSPTTGTTTTGTTTTGSGSTATATSTVPATGTTTTTSTTTTSTTTSPPSLGEGQGQTSPTGGGGQVGLLLISPWVKAGTTDLVDYYNHYSMLASIEDIFNLRHLGYARQSGLPALDAGSFDGAGPSTG